MDIQFYSKVLRQVEEMDEDSTDSFLCLISDDFQHAWTNDKQESIMKDAETFIAQTQKGKIGDTVLFDTEKTSAKQRLDLRISFLNWAIENPQYLL
jgi:hypothetical protein